MSTFDKFVRPLFWKFQERCAWVENLEDCYGALLEKFSGKGGSGCTLCHWVHMCV